jgi:hypothetical protein
MKGIFLRSCIIFIAITYVPQYSFSQSGNVGIGTTSPRSKLMVKTPLNTTGFTHLGTTAGNGSDSVVLAEKIDAASATLGTRTQHPFHLVSGDSKAWVNLIPDGSITIGDSAGTHGYFGSKLAVKSASGTKAVSVVSDDGVSLRSHLALLSVTISVSCSVLSFHHGAQV